MLTHLNPLFKQEEVADGLTTSKSTVVSGWFTGGGTCHWWGFETQVLWAAVMLMICGLTGVNMSPGPGLEYFVLYSVPSVFFCWLLKLWALKFLLLLQYPLLINSTPWWTVSPWEPWIPINTSNFFLWVNLVMMFCPSNEKKPMRWAKTEGTLT